MSDNVVHFATKTKRPERIRYKTCDDNVLGISWREERELRKAMYVSLRQRQPKSSASSKALAKRAPEEHFRIGWRHRRSNPMVKSRDANIQHQGHLDSSSLGKQSSTPVKDDAPVCSLRSPDGNSCKSLCSPGASSKSELGKRTPRRPTKSGLRNARIARSNRSAFIRAFDAIVSSRLRSSNRRNSERTCILSSLSLQEVSPSKSQSSGNVCQSTSERTVSPNSKDRPLRTGDEINQALKHNASPISKELCHEMTKSYQKKTFPDQSIHKTLSVKCAKKTTQVNGNSPSKVGNEQNPLSSSIPSIPSHNILLTDRLPKNLPPEFWQDPHGQPVSVHDFVEYICYHGSPCLDSKLKWFGLPRRPGPFVCSDLIHSHQQISPTQSSKTTLCSAIACPKSASFPGLRDQSFNHGDNTPYDNNTSRGTLPSDKGTASLTKSALGCVAKKVAMVNPHCQPYNLKVKPTETPNGGNVLLTGSIGSTVPVGSVAEKKTTKDGQLARRPLGLSKWTRNKTHTK